MILHNVMTHLGKKTFNQQLTTTVAILPGKHFAPIANDDVTNAASPIDSATRTPSEAQKNSVPEGIKFRNLKCDTLPKVGHKTSNL